MSAATNRSREPPKNTSISTSNKSYHLVPKIGLGGGQALGFVENREEKSVMGPGEPRGGLGG